jgi:sugar-specific transcriptional regulator TrmB
VQSPEQLIQTLVNLGLTAMQAKVYIALVTSGTSTGRTTAKAAKVASQDVYRLLTELQEKGLAEKVIAKPTMYKATPVKEGVDILLENEKQEYIEKEKQAKKLFDNFYENKNQYIAQENVQFTVTSHLSLLIKMHEKMADATKKSIDFYGPLKNEKTLFQECPWLKRAMSRGVKIRVITPKVNGETIAGNSKPKKNFLFELRYLTEGALKFGMHIFDKQEITVKVSEKPLPSLWTNSPHVVELANAYFESLWNNAQQNTLV